MEFSLIALVGISLGAMFFGYFFGLFEGRGQGYRRRKKEEPLERPAEPLGEKSVAATAAAPEFAATHPSAWLELAGDDGGQPRLDLDGHRVDTASLTAAEYKRLIELMIMMRPWVEAAAPVAGSTTVGSGAGPSGPVSSPQQSVEAGIPPAAGSITGVSPLPVPGEVSATTSLVAQIDAILQVRLAGTPLAGTGIRLAESLDGGVIVFVGRQQYAGVADVPDPQVQAAIKAAIAEWEKRYTPG